MEYINFMLLKCVLEEIHHIKLDKTGPNMSPCKSSIVQIIFSFWSFEISEGILRNQIIIIGLDSISNQCLMYLAPFGLY